MVAQASFVVALQYEKAARVSIVNTSQILFAFLIQIYWLDEPTNFYSIAGACLGNSVLTGKLAFQD